MVIEAEPAHRRAIVVHPVLLEAVGEVISGELCHSKSDLLVIPETFFFNLLTSFSKTSTLSSSAPFSFGLRYRQQHGGTMAKLHIKRFLMACPIMQS